MSRRFYFFFFVLALSTAVRNEWFVKCDAKRPRVFHSLPSARQFILASGSFHVVLSGIVYIQTDFSRKLNSVDLVQFYSHESHGGGIEELLTIRPNLESIVVCLVHTRG